MMNYIYSNLENWVRQDKYCDEVESDFIFAMTIEIDERLLDETNHRQHVSYIADQELEQTAEMKVIRQLGITKFSHWFQLTKYNTLYSHSLVTLKFAVRVDFEDRTDLALLKLAKQRWFK